MGLYDEITCNHPFPPGLPASAGPVGWQTKDLDSALLKFVITQTGRLKHVKKDGTEEDVHHHGKVKFYGAFRTPTEQDPELRVMVDLEADFHAGQLKSLRLLRTEEF